MGNITMQHNGDLLIIMIQSKTKLDPSDIKTNGDALPDPYLYTTLEINKTTGELEKQYMGPSGF